MKKNRGDINLARSLCGINTLQAMEMRNLLLDNRVNLKEIVKSLVGINSSRAWEIRELLLETYISKGLMEDKDALGISLAGVNSHKAWEMREFFLSKGGYWAVAMSLAGLNIRRAWNMRGIILRNWNVEDSLKKRVVVMGMTGNDETFFWRFVKKDNKTNK